MSPEQALQLLKQLADQAAAPKSVHVQSDQAFQILAALLKNEDKKSLAE